MFSTINDSWEVVKNIVEKWGFCLSESDFWTLNYVLHK
jgi:hypothetical protein